MTPTGWALPETTRRLTNLFLLTLASTLEPVDHSLRVSSALRLLIALMESAPESRSGALNRTWAEDKLFLAHRPGSPVFAR